MEMEKVIISTEKIAAMAKKLRKLIKGAFYLLKKGISTSKLFLLDFTLLLKRTHKLAAKLATPNDAVFSFVSPSNYTPLPKGRRRCLDKEVLELINGGGDGGSESPAVGLPGFWGSPAAGCRQLRITDSPFPLKENEEEAREVNKAADEFIKRFYRDLLEQKSSMGLIESPYHYTCAS